MDFVIGCESFDLLQLRKYLILNIHIYIYTQKNKVEKLCIYQFFIYKILNFAQKKINNNILEKFILEK